MPHPNLPGTDETILETSVFGRWRARALVIVLCAAAAIYSVWWFWLAAQVHEQVDGWVAAMRADGHAAAYGSLDIGGFPGPLGIDLSSIDAAGLDDAWKIHVPALRANLAPWDIGTLSGTFTGLVSGSLRGGAAGGTYTLTADNNAFTLNRDAGGTLRTDLRGVRAVRTEAGVDAVATADTLTLSLIRATSPVYGRVEIDARDVALPPEMHSAFGGHVARFRTTAEATGAELPEGLSAAALRVWSNEGGAVDIRALDVVHGVLGLNGEGTLALDGNLQPIGAFTAGISGFNAAVDTLVAARVARPEDGALAKVVLGVLAKSPPGGGPKQVKLPLTLQDRVLSVGPIKLIRLRRIQWE